MRTSIAAVAAALCLGLVMLVPALGQEGYEFMPAGGKALLLRLLGDNPDAAAVREAVLTERAEAAWQDWVAAQGEGLTETQRRTLAVYATVNLPVAESALDKARQKGNWREALPPGGRTLAWNYCQFCHSLFTGYLTQERDVQGWRSTFETPFHKEIGMARQQQETFAHYSAINMPIPVEDVPPALRF